MVLIDHIYKKVTCRRASDLSASIRAKSAGFKEKPKGATAGEWIWTNWGPKVGFIGPGMKVKGWWLREVGRSTKWWFGGKTITLLWVLFAYAIHKRINQAARKLKSLIFKRTQRENNNNYIMYVFVWVYLSVYTEKILGMEIFIERNPRKCTGGFFFLIILNDEKGVKEARQRGREMPFMSPTCQQRVAGECLCLIYMYSFALFIIELRDLTWPTSFLVLHSRNAFYYLLLGFLRIYVHRTNGLLVDYNHCQKKK